VIGGCGVGAKPEHRGECRHYQVSAYLCCFHYCDSCGGRMTRRRDRKGIGKSGVVWVLRSIGYFEPHCNWYLDKNRGFEMGRRTCTVEMRCCCTSFRTEQPVRGASPACSESTSHMSRAIRIVSIHTKRRSAGRRHHTTATAQRRSRQSGGATASGRCASARREQGSETQIVREAESPACSTA